MRVALLLCVMVIVTAKRKKMNKSQIKMNEFTCGRYYYRTFRLEEDREVLFVGAMNRMYKLYVKSFNRRKTCQKDLMELPADEEAVQACKEANNETADYQCGNHIKVIQRVKEGDMLYVCGTNAGKPMDWILDSYMQKQPNDSMPAMGDGTGRCPPSPEDAATAIWVKEGNAEDLHALYSATVNGKKSMVGRMPLFQDGTQVVPAMKMRNDWIQKPVFVGSFEVDEHIYFFYRDGVKEKKSFVGRVCKNDIGNEKFSNGTWTTWQRARLNCSSEETTYDEIQAVYRAEYDEPLFHGAFISGNKSAVCVYSLADMRNTFRGEYLKGDDKPPSEISEISSRPSMCGNDSRDFSEEVVKYAHAHTAMKDRVPSMEKRPLYVRDDATFSSIVYHREQNPENLYTVLYIGTTDGVVIKAIVGNDTDAKKNEYVEDLTLVEGETIRVMEISLKFESVYAGWDGGVTQLQIQVCSSPDYSVPEDKFLECVLGEEEAANVTTRPPGKLRQRNLFGASDEEVAKAKDLGTYNVSIDGSGLVKTIACVVAAVCLVALACYFLV